MRAVSIEVSDFPLMLQVCSLLTLVGCISVTPHKSMPHAHAHTPHTRTHITHIRHVCVCPAAPPKLEDVLTSRKAIQRVKAAAHEATTNVDERGYEVCVLCVH